MIRSQSSRRKWICGPITILKKEDLDPNGSRSNHDCRISARDSQGFPGFLIFGAPVSQPVCIFSVPVSQPACIFSVPVSQPDFVGSKGFPESFFHFYYKCINDSLLECFKSLKPIRLLLVLGRRRRPQHE